MLLCMRNYETNKYSINIHQLASQSRDVKTIILFTFPHLRYMQNINSEKFTHGKGLSREIQEKDQFWGQNAQIYAKS